METAGAAGGRGLAEVFDVAERAEGDIRSARLVALLFADIEGSTRLLADLGDDYERLLAGYYEVLRAALAEHGGTEVGTQGDGFFAVFRSARAAVAAAVAAQRALAAGGWPGDVELRVRMGLHTGEASEGPGGPVGLDVHRAARIAAAAHGGQILISDAVRVLAEHHLPAGVSLRSLGVHRLKDLAEPEPLYQLCSAGLLADFPPIRTLDAAPNNLPTVLTSFVGRERVLARVQELLAAHRLVTLTGPGGTGKTRLALQTAARLLEGYRDGVWFVPLAPIRDPGLLSATILESLQIPLAPKREPRHQLLELLHDRELLLVLDNFEQLLDGAPFVSELLQAAPAVRVLVTSRAPLHLSGEHELPVPTLGVPDLEHLPSLESLSQYEAVALFIERATAARPDFAVTNVNAPAVAEIAARLDGLPLAIELAAARVKVLPPEAMLARLDRRLVALGTGPRDVPERQQTLRQAIAWSYDLLDDAGRRLLACLGVFVDGWTLEHAEAVCPGAVDILEGVTTLLDHSLVQERDGDGGARFGMLQTIREYALERLDELPEAAEVRQRHAATFLALAETAAPHLLGREQASWAARLDGERGNLRAALDEFVERGDAARATRMGVALWRYWQKSAVHEGRERMAEILRLDAGQIDAALRSGGLEAAGGLAYWAGDMVAARLHYEDALALERRIDRPGGVANALYNLVFAHLFEAELEESWRLAQESRERFEAVGDVAGAAKARWALGCVAYFQGRYDRAEEELLASLDAALALDDVFLGQWSRHMLAITLLRRGDPRAARPLLREALTFFAEVGDVAAVAMLLDDYAALADAEGRGERQARLAAATVALRHLSGSELSRVSAELEGRTPVDPDTFAAAWKEGLAMSVADAVDYALSDADTPGE